MLSSAFLSVTLLSSLDPTGFLPTSFFHRRIPRNLINSLRNTDSRYLNFGAKQRSDFNQIGSHGISIRYTYERISRGFRQWHVVTAGASFILKCISQVQHGYRIH